MREILYMVLVLTGTAVVSGLSLASINNLTKDTIELSMLKNVKEPAIQEILAGFDNDPIGERSLIADPDGVELTIFPTRQGGEFMGVAIEGSGKGYGGPVGVMVGIGADGKLTGIGITSHSETPGLGARATEPAFCEQFAGMEWASAKTVGDIDAISGATITSGAVVDAVNQATAVFEANRDELTK